MDEGHWIAAHIFRAAPNRTFFVDAIQPFVAGAGARRFFFIRYPERGPHVRLRFLLPDASAEPEFRARIAAHFRAYMDAQPSQRTDEHPDWYPNDSVQFLSYEPELERYGGVAGIGIAEEQFEASSRAALNAFAAASKWTVVEGLRTAIGMHIGFAVGLGFTPAAAARFFGALSVEWLHWHPDVPTGTTLDPARMAQLTTGYEQRFASERAVLVPFIGALWQALATGETEEWLVKWVDSMRRIRARLETLRNAGQTRVSVRTDKSVRPTDSLHAILGSYVHMTNNRLAVMNLDEPYLCYLLRRSLECL